MLLIIEDYSEVTFLQTMLMKLGFRVDSVNKQNRVGNSLMLFQPQVIITTAKGRAINGLKLVLDFRKKYPQMHYVFIKHKGQDFVDKLVQDGLIAGALETPIDPRQLIKILCEVAQLNPEDLLEKYQKFTQKTEDLQIRQSESYQDSDSQNQSIYVTSSSSSDEGDSVRVGGSSSLQRSSSSRGPSHNTVQTDRESQWDLSVGYSVTDEERRQRYQSFVDQAEKKPIEMALDREQVKKATQEASQSQSLDEEVLHSKQDFVKALFTG